MDWTHLVLLLSSAGGLAAGMWLCISGRFPRRTGVTPYCRACRYNLTGTDLTSGGARCPECGAYLTTEHVLLGERHIRRGYICAGLTLAAAGLLAISTVVAFRLGRINWYPYAPTWWVMRDARSPNAGKARHAYAELTARLNAGRLKPRDHQAVVETCLAEQPQARLGAAPADILATLYAARALSEAQQCQFFENMVQLRLRAASPAVRGTRMPVLVLRRWTGPSRGFSCEMKAGPFLVDGNALAVERWWFGNGSDLTGYGWPYWCVTVEDVGAHEHGVANPLKPGGCVRVEDLGAHDLRTQVRVRVHEGDDRGRFATPVIHTYERALQTSFQALEQTPEVDPLPTPSAEALRALVQVAVIRRSPPPDNGSLEPDTTVEVRFSSALPVNLSCKVVVIDGDASHEVDVVAAHRGQSSSWSGDARLGHPSADRVDVLLRPSPVGAVFTWDIDDFWPGELRFRDVPVICEPERIPFGFRRVRVGPFWQMEPLPPTSAPRPD
jgi:hypothetical protein